MFIKRAILAVIVTLAIAGCVSVSSVHSLDGPRTPTQTPRMAGPKSDRLTISIAKSVGGTTYGFRGLKQLDFAAVNCQLNKFAETNKGLEVTFIVCSNVTVQEVLELVYRVHALGFTNIAIATNSADNLSLDKECAIFKVQVKPEPPSHFDGFEPVPTGRGSVENDSLKDPR